jgi:putative transposase
MAEHHQEYPVTTMCHVLEVSVSGDSAWHTREPSWHSREDAELANKIKGAFQSNRCVYGSSRLHAELHA